MSRDSRALLQQLSNPAFLQNATNGLADWADCDFRQGWSTVVILRNMVAWGHQVRALLPLLKGWHQLWLTLLPSHRLHATEWALRYLPGHLGTAIGRWERCLQALEVLLGPCRSL